MASEDVRVWKMGTDGRWKRFTFPANASSIVGWDEAGTATVFQLEDLWQTTFADVAFDGKYSSLLEKPSFDGTYGSLTGKPSFATVASSGSYNDLSNKPSIPATQVNADWSAVSGVSQILNKPTIPANGVSLVGTAIIAESSLLTLALTVRRVNVSVAGVTIGSNYIAIPTAALPTGYGIVDVICTTNGTLSFGMLVPVLSVGSSYSISVRILKLTP